MLIAFHLDYYFRYQPRAKVGLYSASHTTVILPGQLIIESPASQNLMVPSATLLVPLPLVKPDAWAYCVDPHSLGGESSPNIGSLQATHMEPFVYH